MQRRDNTCNNGVVFSRALTSEKSAARSLSAELLECARLSAAKVCHVSFTVPFQIETSTDIDGQGTVAGCRDMPQHPRAQCCDLHFDPDARSALLCNVLRLPGAWQEDRGAARPGTTYTGAARLGTAVPGPMTVIGSREVAATPQTQVPTQECSRAMAFCVLDKELEAKARILIAVAQV
eukprot:s4703_g2.t1